MDLGALSSAPDWKQFAATWVDADGIKTSIATATTAQTYTTFNGALTSGGAFSQSPSTKVTVTLSSSAGSYSTSPITVTGTDEDGNSIIDTLTPTTANGNETLSTTKGFASVSSIAVPAQNNTSGAFTFGTGAIKLTRPARAIEAGAAGDFKIRTQGGVLRTITLAQGAYRSLAIGGVDDDQAVFPFILYR